MSPWEEALVVELRRSLVLPLHDVLEAMRRRVNPKLRAAACTAASSGTVFPPASPPKKQPAAAFQIETPNGFIHIDVKCLPPLNRRRSYAYVAISLCLYRNPSRSSGRNRRRPSRALPRPLPAQGSHHLDRQRLRIHRPLRRRQKRRSYDKPSGAHPFDRACSRQAMAHRPTRPSRPSRRPAARP
jgi:hypothetical protein